MDYVKSRKYEADLYVIFCFSVVISSIQVLPPFSSLTMKGKLSHMYVYFSRVRHLTACAMHIKFQNITVTVR